MSEKKGKVVEGLKTAGVWAFFVVVVAFFIIGSVGIISSIVDFGSDISKRVGRSIDGWHYHMTVYGYDEHYAKYTEAYVFTKDNCGHPDYALVPEVEFGKKGRVFPKYKQVFPILLNPNYHVEGDKTSQFRYMSRADYFRLSCNYFFNCSFQDFDVGVIGEFSR